VWVKGSYPATTQGVEICAADAAVRDFDVDVGFFPGLGREFLPHHLAFGGVLVEAEPACEFIVCHGYGW
jgi:hypothetical protein